MDENMLNCFVGIGSIFEFKFDTFSCKKGPNSGRLGTYLDHVGFEDGLAKFFSPI